MTQPVYSEFDWPWSAPYPFSQWVRVGQLVMLSGQVAFAPDGRIVGVDDIAAQARQIFENVGTLLADAGLGFGDIVQLRSYFAMDMADEAAMARFFAVRRAFFGDHRPISTGVRVASLIHPDLLVEVEVTAVVSAR